MDNATNNNTFARSLDELVAKSPSGGIFSAAKHRLRRFAHVINLVDQAGLGHECLKPVVEKVRETLRLVVTTVRWQTAFVDYRFESCQQMRRPHLSDAESFRKLVHLANAVIWRLSWMWTRAGIVVTT